MILKYNDFLFEYNNRNLYLKVLELEKKYPDLICSKWDKLLNDNYLNSKINHKHINQYESLMTKEFINDCLNIGIHIKDIIESAKYKNRTYMSWILYDGENYKICPGGGEDYLSAKVLGSGAQKIVYQSRDYVLKKLEDVSSFELYISNKYPEYFAIYELAGNMVKQEKLDTNNLYKDSNNDIFYKLYSKIHNIVENEIFNGKSFALDIHRENVGFDKDNKLKCFDFLNIEVVSIFENLLKDKLLLSSIIKPAEIQFLKEKFDINIENTLYTIINKNNKTNSLNFIDPVNKILYINHTYKEIVNILNENFILFGISDKDEQLRNEIKNMFFFQQKT
jgi:hypothetical protein